MIYDTNFRPVVSNIWIRICKSDVQDDLAEGIKDISWIFFDGSNYYVAFVQEPENNIQYRKDNSIYYPAVKMSTLISNRIVKPKKQQASANISLHRNNWVKGFQIFCFKKFLTLMKGFGKNDCCKPTKKRFCFFLAFCYSSPINLKPGYIWP